MKKTYILLLAAVATLTSCGMIAQSSSSDDGHRFSDGIYDSAPSFRTKEEKAAAKLELESLIAQTKESPIYLFGDKKDTIMIPENFSARIQYDQKVGGTVVTVGENPYDWRWDLENNYGYYYGPYSIGSSWYWSRHYSPYWSSWGYTPWYHSRYYDPWYYGSFYDPWYYGGFYDPWYYGGYYNPWHHHYHCGWYDPYYHHHHHHHRPPIIDAPSTGGNVHHGLRAHTESTRGYSSSSGATGRGSESVRTTSGTVRGGMSVGNRTSRASSSSGRSSTAPTYRRPSGSNTSSGSSAGYSRGSSSGSSSGYSRGSSSGSSSYSRGSSSYERGSSSYDRSSSYSRGSSSGSSSGYSRGSSSGGSSGYSRGGSSGGYRR